MSKNLRNWTVLFIGGASGTGKSSIAYEIAKYYDVNVMEIDDIYEAVKAMTTIESHPAIHYWSTGINWLDIGIDDNIKWLNDVSLEMLPALKAVAHRHVEDNLPIVIEGDFIHPKLAHLFDSPDVKIFFIKEHDESQILQNYLMREGGELQNFRAKVSASYDKWLSDSCEKLGIKVVEARPWNTAIKRIIDANS